MTAAGPAFIFAITTANHNQQEGQQAAEDQRQRPEPIRDDRGPFSFYRQREPPSCRTLPESAQDQGEGPRGYPRRAPTVPAPIYTQGGFFSYARLKSDPKEKHTPRPARVNSGFNFSGCAAIRSGTAGGKPPPHARRRKRARYFPAADPITARGARFFPGRERKKSVLFATHCRYFPFFQPKKKSHRAGKSRHKKYYDKSDTLKRGPADFENRGEGAGRRHATTAQAGEGAV